MILWIKELERKLDKSTPIKYVKLRNLKEEKFQGNLRINFVNGNISSINKYDTIQLG